jgi:hypothetical protein
MCSARYEAPGVAMEAIGLARSVRRQKLKRARLGVASRDELFPFGKVFYHQSGVLNL